ncbi:MAG: hypothetical protein LAO23_19565 [Acidobacteriia bacterium]|nr:hypothetical protein [Terriglobia bacterium]
MANYAEKIVALLSYGYTIGQRDSRINRNYPGKHMVVEAYEEHELPTDDGSNGPWCVVGDNLTQLIDQGWEFLQSTLPTK